MRAVVVGLAGVGAVLGACSVTQPWPADRAWIDSGCEAAGSCGARGRLAVTGGIGLLTLDDGRCLPIVLPPRIAAEQARWHNRRVAVRGYAVDRTREGGRAVGERCSSSPWVIEARRFSLKADR